MMRRVTITAVLIGSLASSVATYAQETRSNNILDEVIVTAQKREQSLQDVGISVTAFTGEQIHELGFTNSTDVVSMTPGLNYTVPNAESSQINFFLRGVGLNDFADANENPVAVYVDDVYHPAMGGLSFQLFDMERVEVLRGPQGTLFGRNTTGGLVHFISKRPTRELDGYFNVSAGAYNEIKTEAAIGGPLGDTVAGRISVASDNHKGWTENRAGPDFNGADAIAARGQLEFTPRDAVDLLFIGSYSKNDSSVGAWQHESTKFDANGESVPLGPDEQDMSVDCNADGTLDANDLRPAPGTDCFGYTDDDGDPWAGAYDRDGRVKVEASDLSMKLDWTFNNMTLTSITAGQRVERLQSEDTDAGPFPLIMPTFQAKTNTFTEELRLAGESDKIRWLAGLYYFNNDVDGHYTLDLTNLGFVYFDANFTQKTDSLALFGQLEIDLSDHWRLTVGGRAAQEKKELDYLNRDTSGFFTDVVGLPTDVAFEFNEATVGDLAKHDDDSYSGKIQLDWRPTDDLLLYGSISQGTKSAGFNVGFLDQTFLFASNTIDTIPYGAETLRSFEVGFKSTLGAHTRLNGAAFVYDYMDFQTFRFELLNQVIFNTDADVHGGELELQTSPIDGLDIALGLALLDAKAHDIPSPAGVLRDRHMVAAPDVAANALIRYSWPAGERGRIALQAWANYQDAVYYDIQNVPVSRQGGYTVSNLRAAYQGNDGRWEIAAFVNNLSDEAYKSYTFDFTGTFGFNQVSYGRPRWYGISFNYNLK